MSLFQKSVLNKYLKAQDEKQVKAAYQRFTEFFHNPEIIQSIIASKEEQFQYGFLENLFDKILNYTINPKPNFDLTTELKNLKGAKKADGAILKDDKAIGVIELKGTKTKDLDKITEQAFGYKNNHPTCVYIVTSNFEKLRFYINDAVEYEEFHLFSLSEERFALLYLCLHRENIFADLPQKIKNESTLKEEEITKELYKHYSEFKRTLFNNIVELNPELDKLFLFKKTQKLLDRFLFIFFAEDKGLLPPNAIGSIIKQWGVLKDNDEYQPLYNRFKKFFGYLDKGYKGKMFDIPAFNGGLFTPDETLDTIKIDDEIIAKYTKEFSNYDFESEVDVNILGHIFEHSLNEIEEVTAELEGTTVEKNKTKRKKDGVFYTPKYITKYIVDNTVGKLCQEKKEELELLEIDFSTSYKTKKRRTTKDGKKTNLSVEGEKILNGLDAYRDFLLKLTICDPACGSGAFLNQALDFLIKAHHDIDEMQTKLMGGSIVFPDVEAAILENNLYGVDINDESVDIAKLSLWLRTAKKGRILTTLNNNIKCGNSLIDDKAVAGEKAFNWKKEFPEVFKNGGFDVVVGNPPYVRNESISKTDKEYFESKYSTFTGKSDLYVYFFEQVINITNSGAKCSFIVSSKFTKTKYGKKLIKFLYEKSKIQSFIDFRDLDVFNGIIAYPSIIIFENNKPKNGDESNLLVVDGDNFRDFHNGIDKAAKVKTKELFDRLGSWNSSNEENLLFDIVRKLQEENVNLEYHNAIPQVGIKTGYNKAYLIEDEVLELNNSNYLKDYIVGRNVKRYQPTTKGVKAIIPYEENEEKQQLILPESDKEIFEYLSQHKEKLSNRAVIDKGIEKGTKTWYQFQQIKLDFPYSKKYIVYPDISGTVNFTFAENSYFDMTCFGIPVESHELLGILNSKLMLSILEMICVKARGGYLRLKSQYLLELPLPKELTIPSLEKKVIIQLELNGNLTELITKYNRQIQRRFKIEKLSGKLEEWHTLTFAEFVKELKKKKIKLSLSEEAEWEDYFEAEKEKAQAIQSEIDKTDRAIDQMVYELYGLTEEEIRIVEGS